MNWAWWLRERESSVHVYGMCPINRITVNLWCSKSAVESDSSASDEGKIRGR